LLHHWLGFLKEFQIFFQIRSTLLRGPLGNAAPDEDSGSYARHNEGNRYSSNSGSRNRTQRSNTRPNPAPFADTQKVIGFEALLLGLNYFLGYSYLSLDFLRRFLEPEHLILRLFRRRSIHVKYSISG
jgi:hypothetical protein